VGYAPRIADEFDLAIGRTRCGDRKRTNKEKCEDADRPVGALHDVLQKRSGMDVMPCVV
jgi:hypothetical protein